MRTAIVLFTRDLRVHDNPALSAGCARAERVVPLFVFDPAVLAGMHRSANRVRFLLESLADLRASLRGLGGGLVIRHGDPVAQVVRLAGETSAREVFCADDVSGYAERRRRRLADACAGARLGLATHPGITVVPPDALLSSAGGRYKVFTPYWRAWQEAPRRAEVAPPAAVRLPAGVRPGRLPALRDLVDGRPSGNVIKGGESAGRARLRNWLAGPVRDYAEGHDDLPGDRTSRLSAYLHLGCLSPAELARAGGDSVEFVRQLAWRDFFHQLTAGFPGIARDDYRPRERTWRDDPEALAAWRAGRTGVPVVDAGMRQLLDEGWMPNRARLITASFLCRRLGIDWRAGARHYMELLVDGDLANNHGNWQWVAGTGTDPQPGRVLNPLRQARRFDPDGVYVRRYVPELADTDRRSVHHPWRSGTPGYPPPLIDLPPP